MKKIDVMDASFRQAFGERLRTLRKRKKWVQKELGFQLGLTTAQLHKYENGMSMPPADKLLTLARIFDVTIEYLLTGEMADHTDLANSRFMERLRAIEALEDGDQEAVFRVLDAMIIKHRIEGLVDPVKKRVG